MSMNDLSGAREKGRSGGSAPLMVQCSSCGAIGYPADRYCACCGIVMPRRCRGCDAPILHRAANYCTQCGASFAERPQADR